MTTTQTSAGQYSPRIVRFFPSCTLPVFRVSKSIVSASFTSSKVRIEHFSTIYRNSAFSPRIISEVHHNRLNDGNPHRFLPPYFYLGSSFHPSYADDVFNVYLSIFWTDWNNKAISGYTRNFPLFEGIYLWELMFNCHRINRRKRICVITLTGWPDRLSFYSEDLI